MSVKALAAELSSPHTRRYFLNDVIEVGIKTLFSAHAEVFPHPESAQA